MDIRREIKSYVVREGMTMREVLVRLIATHKWSGAFLIFLESFAEELFVIRKPRR